MSKFIRSLGSVAFASALLLSALPAQAAVGVIPDQNAQSSQTTSCHTFTTSLHFGDHGSEVAALQQALSKAGFGISNDSEQPQREGDTVDSYRFGESTKAAVISFQQKYGIVPAAGYFGPLTRAKLSQLYGCSSGALNNPPESTGPSTVVCRPGDIFNRITGQRCDGGSQTPLVCGPGAKFNSITGKPCSITSLTPDTIPTIPKIDVTAPSQYDYTGEGMATMDDVLALQAIIADGKDCPKTKVCDINKDGHTDVADTVALTAIVKKGLSPFMDVTNPVGGATLTAGNSYPIRWTSSASPYFDITYANLDGGWIDGLSGKLSAGSVDSGLTTTNSSGTAVKIYSYVWNIPQNLTPGHYTVSVFNGTPGPDGAATLSDSSDTFTIVAPSTSNSSGEMTGNKFDFKGNDNKVTIDDVNELAKIVTGDEMCPVGKQCDVNGDGPTNIADTIRLLNLVKYDLNSDNVINNKDSLILTDVINNDGAGCPANKTCDVNGDGHIDVADAVALVKKF